MAFTMHSHSGQFCPGHAKDQLEAIIQHAISIGYKTMGLTEHMPRLDIADLYPEEATPKPPCPSSPPVTRPTSLRLNACAKNRPPHRLRGEWYRPAYGPFIKSLASHPAVDYFIGSLHHVNAVPIDYSREMYIDAMNTAGGNEEKMYERYYDQQHEMLTALEPRIVGHFDLVRLMSEDPGRDVRKWKGVWERIVRNLGVVRGYGGLLECNSSALRKGLDEPYPCRVIAEAWLKMGGRFTFSDDSHGIAQVATNYKRNLDYLESLGVKEVYTFERGPVEGVNGHAKAALREKGVALGMFRENFK
ncbi:putative histidinol-phosphatase [Colletotrichum liriopes]|uniref:Histidinol-phosphatase n=1 Tax=Colletotrichum liriopes TaxID=708192 RepID=A0AA37GDT1_9PEZI|nr:putative histidinol-phosphatase [Colletotrichum liriopes]